ncbi:NusA-like transcription termination signal-binding factor [archaeon]|jgi:transcription termination/antitermination protein NusA|nr:NusA-like transcription termination signal-binding factor [archaeon]MBT4397226.1 NusA-like transcription termination signal-binding factor [archaeon]MBT4440606.1 NusA-like transcription termination signal-binding factor [archaeon]
MISYDQKTIGFINVFERSTRAQVKDCFEEEDSLVFVVQPGQIGFAIGKKGANVKKLNLMFKRKIKIIEFNPSPKHFLLNLLYPIKVEIEVKEEEIVIKTENTKQKGQIFGRDRTNLKRKQAIMDKYFKLKIVLE